MKIKYAKRFLAVILGLAVFLFLDYVLPRNDIVAVTDAYSRITKLGANRIFYAQDDVGAESGGDLTRDIRFVSGVKPSGRVKVYRNEDTGWVWPPYFKYDSSNLQAEFAGSTSTVAKPEWMRVTSYGWRVPWLSIYPNAISVAPVAGPDASTASLTALLALFCLYWFLFFIWTLWNRFVRRSVKPAIEDIDETLDGIRDGAVRTVDTRTRGFRDWLNTWRGIPRKR